NLMLGFMQRPPTQVLVLAIVFSAVVLSLSRIWSGKWGGIKREEINVLKRIERPVRRVLVIGGAGYIGSALLPMLLRRGYKVRLLDLAIFGTDPIQEYLDHPNLEFIKGDYRQIDIVIDSMQKADAVVHLGGLVGDPACSINEEATVDVNLVATRLLMEAARVTGVQRFIFASTCSVYGASESDELLDENSRLNPVSLYAKSKIGSERIIHELAGTELHPVILRFGTVFGFSGRIRFDLVINLLTAMAYFEKKITIFGGMQWRPFVHVEDAASSIRHALEAPLAKVSYQTFNVGSNSQNYMISDIGDFIKKRMPEAEVMNKDEDADLRNYRVSFDKISRELGFEAKWTVEEGIDQVIDAIRTGRVKDFRNPNYNNFKFLNENGNMSLITEYNNWTQKLMDTQQPARAS
ncbi:NAD-dependent epimerase/dehydratase family protein, partial [bacterium]|nr:NAD-dependent epimerase/dehydratase family protein [bacterium]